jgi:DNA-binding NarL/FixJ family response regulator
MRHIRLYDTSARRGKGLCVLSPREREILALIASGFANKEIAHRLRIRLSTLKGHVARLMAGLELSNRVELAMWAHWHPEALTGHAVAPGLHGDGCPCPSCALPKTGTNGG